jgi:uncharacterized protein
MPEYKWPGVYVEEVPSGIQPIAGIGTSTAAFIGISQEIVGPWDQEKKQGMPRNPAGNAYEQKPPDIPQPVNSWTEFTQKFGDIQEANEYLAQAVFGFFNNGGMRCWVIRVAADGNVVKVLPKLESIDEIAIVAAPLPPTVPQETLHGIQDTLVAHCQKMETRTAVLDSARDIDDDNLVITDNDTGIWRPTINKKGYGAFYFPWVYVADPIRGGRVAVPPSGHVTGIYARSDAERGVQKAPANEIILGALDLKYQISNIIQGDLNLQGVDCIRSFSGTIKVYGARTLASDPEHGDIEWQYVSVRRLVNFLRGSIETGTQWVVFEPNAQDLWAKIRRNVGAFLYGQWAAGALVGNTPEQAFYVRCDENTNPPDVRALGRVVTEIGVAVVRPAEFVVFKLSQWSGPAQ